MLSTSTFDVPKPQWDAAKAEATAIMVERANASDHLIDPVRIGFIAYRHYVDDLAQVPVCKDRLGDPHRVHKDGARRSLIRVLETGDRVFVVFVINRDPRRKRPTVPTLSDSLRRSHLVGRHLVGLLWLVRFRSSMAWVQRRPPRCAPSALRPARTWHGKPFLSCRTTSAGTPKASTPKELPPLTH